MKSKNIIKITILIIISILTFCFIMKNFFPAEWSFITPHKQGDFVRVGNMHDYMCRHQMILLDDGRVFVYKNGRIEIYSPKTRRFKDLGVKIKDIHEASNAIKLKDGRIMIFRGYVAKKNYSSPETFFFDPETEKVTQGPNMTISRANHSSILLDDGRVFISGGFNAYKKGCIYLKSTEFYNPKTNKFEQGLDLKQPREYHSSLLTNDGNILILGGLGAYVPKQEMLPKVLDAELYNPRTNQITVVGELLNQRSDANFIKLKSGEIYIVEGFPHDSNQPGSARVIEKYNPKTNTSTIVNKRTSPVEFITTALLLDDTILFSGGYSGFSIGYTKSSNTQIYNPKTNKFITPKNTSQNPIAKGTSIMLKDGNILMTGGGIDGSKKAAIYMFNKKIER